MRPIRVVGNNSSKIRDLVILRAPHRKYYNFENNNKTKENGDHKTIHHQITPVINSSIISKPIDKILVDLVGCVTPGPDYPAGPLG